MAFIENADNVDLDPSPGYNVAWLVLLFTELSHYFEKHSSREQGINKGGEDWTQQKLYGRQELFLIKKRQFDSGWAIIDETV